MSINILMPALSPTMTEGKLAKWHVKVGDAVKAGQVICEIETDKATMEVEAVDEGTIFVDDDLDGYAETDDDCDDSDPLLNPDDADGDGIGDLRGMIGDEVAQTFFGQHHRVRDDVALQVLARVLLVRAHCVAAHVARHVGPGEVRRQVAAPVRAAHLEVRELAHLARDGVREHDGAEVLVLDVDEAASGADGPLVGVLGEVVLAQLAADDGAEAGGKARLVHPELVRAHAALHQRLAEPPGGVDQDHPAESALGVQREHGAGARQVAAHHALHAHGQRH